MTRDDDRVSDDWVETFTRRVDAALALVDTGDAPPEEEAGDDEV